MFTRQSDYALRIMLYFAQSGNGGHPVSTDALSRSMDVPYGFLRRIVSRLVAANLLEATRGRGGGVIQARPSGEISVFDVLNAIDPRALHLNGCLLDEDVCARMGHCPIRKKIKTLQSDVWKRLGGMTFESLARNKP